MKVSLLFDCCVGLPKMILNEFGLYGQICQRDMAEFQVKSDFLLISIRCKNITISDNSLSNKLDLVLLGLDDLF